jgi:hypothetical protein
MSATITGGALRLSIAALLLPAGSLAADHPPQETGLAAAVTGGTVYGQLRPRYEYVDQQGFNKEADAFTLRTRLGYKTADWKRFSAVLEFEDIRAFGDENFNSTVNNHSRYPVVPDPDSTEVNQAFIHYAGPAGTALRVGRQFIAFDNERWIGTVGWRQNSVSMDALSVSGSLLPDTTLTYDYVDNVNRLFGEDHPTQSDWNMSSHLVHISYTGLPLADITGYAYFLDFDDPTSEALSTRTLGLRLDGKYAPGEAWQLLYTAEYADQEDYADGRPGDADYYWLTLGLGYQEWSVKVNQERLGGNGRYSLSTPLATVHAHNGWADKFLGTPVDGLVDTSVELSGALAGFKLVARYHDFQSDNGSYDYGREWNLLAVRPLNKHLKAIAKYADYSADDNATNVTRNAAQRTDVRKFWFMVDFTF